MLIRWSHDAFVGYLTPQFQKNPTCLTQNVIKTPSVFGSVVTVGTMVAKTALARWLLSKPKATVRIPAVALGLIRRQVLLLTDPGDKMSWREAHINRGADSHTAEGKIIFFLFYLRSCHSHPLCSFLLWGSFRVLLAPFLPVDSDPAGRHVLLTVQCAGAVQTGSDGHCAPSSLYNKPTNPKLLDFEPSAHTPNSNTWDLTWPVSLQVAAHMQHMLLPPQSAETLTPSYTPTSWRATAATMPFPPAPNWSFLTRRCRCETFGWRVNFSGARLNYLWPFWCVLMEKCLCLSGEEGVLCSGG